jgi:DNA-directed RNA polymerase specialized sigma24 family protein
MYFPTTQWTLLAQATLSGETAGRQAMEDLCRRYWSPLYQFIRARGYNEAEAKDLTQEFLVHLVEHSTLQKADRSRGKFRSFLCGALVRFLADAFDKRQAQKRGGGAPHVELDSAAEELGAISTPDELVFDREWALVTLENALRTVEQQFKGAEKQFAVLRQFLPGSIAVPSYDEAATQLSLNLAALKSELYRLRQRFKAAVREEVAATVSAPHEIDQEMDHLQKVLMNRGIDWGPGQKPSPPNS